MRWKMTWLKQRYIEFGSFFLFIVKQPFLLLVLSCNFFFLIWPTERRNDDETFFRVGELWLRLSKSVPSQHSGLHHYKVWLIIGFRPWSAHSCDFCVYADCCSQRRLQYMQPPPAVSALRKCECWSNFLSCALILFDWHTSLIPLTAFMQLLPDRYEPMKRLDEQYVLAWEVIAELPGAPLINQLLVGARPFLFICTQSSSTLCSSLLQLRPTFRNSSFVQRQSTAL